MTMEMLQGDLKAWMALRTRWLPAWLPTLLPTWLVCPDEGYQTQDRVGSAQGQTHTVFPTLWLVLVALGATLHSVAEA
jgi:hypothetical protein